MTRSYILLEGLRFHAYHGVMEQERLTGNDYTVDLRIGFDIRKAAESDCVDDTLNYASAYEMVKEEMAIPSALVEHVAQRIVNRLRKSFPTISSVYIKLLKINPPMGADAKGVGVELFFE